MRTSRLSVLAICAGVALPVSTLVADQALADKDDAIDVRVAASQQIRVKLRGDITRLSSGSTEICDVKAFESNQLLITGKRPGNTNATVWTRRGIKMLRIAVTYPEEEIRAAMKRAIPDSRGLDARSTGAALMLSGEVPSVADVERAETIARGIVAGIVGTGDIALVNGIVVSGNQQVQLEVSFAEVSRTALREIGFNFWNKKTYDSGKGYAGGLAAPSNGLENMSPELTTTPDLGDMNAGETGFDSNAPYAPKSPSVPLVGGPISDTFGFVFSSSLGGFPFSAALSILSRKGYARTLAEPTLVAMSGKTASFLAGGEFPIPLPQSLGQIAVEFRNFGIELEFTPTVVGDNIQLKLAMTVSDVDGSLGIKLASTTVPGLTKRSSETTVRLKDGQSFVIAGLLSDKVRSSVDKVPWLGDLPILGTLFRSSSYRRDESELLVVVTAHRVAPLSERPALPGEHTTTDPSDLELFLLGKYESIDTEDDEPQPRIKKRKHRKREPVGAVGFQR